MEHHITTDIIVLPLATLCIILNTRPLPKQASTTPSSPLQLSFPPTYAGMMMPTTSCLFTTYRLDTLRRCMSRRGFPINLWVVSFNLAHSLSKLVFLFLFGGWGCSFFQPPSFILERALSQMLFVFMSL